MSQSMNHAVTLLEGPRPEASGWIPVTNIRLSALVSLGANGLDPGDPGLIFTRGYDPRRVKSPSSNPSYRVDPGFVYPVTPVAEKVFAKNKLDASDQRVVDTLLQAQQGTPNATSAIPTMYGLYQGTTDIHITDDYEAVRTVFGQLQQSPGCLAAAPEVLRSVPATATTEFFKGAPEVINALLDYVSQQVNTPEGIGLMVPSMLVSPATARPTDVFTYVSPNPAGRIRVVSVDYDKHGHPYKHAVAAYKRRRATGLLGPCREMILEFADAGVSEREIVDRLIADCGYKAWATATTKEDKDIGICEEDIVTVLGCRGVSHPLVEYVPYHGVANVWLPKNRFGHWSNMREKLCPIPKRAKHQYQAPGRARRGQSVEAMITCLDAGQDVVLS
jgi:hypothetical protein